MSEKDILGHIPDDTVDAILAEVLGTEGSHLAKRYSSEGTSITPPQPAEPEEPAVQPLPPRVATPKNTAAPSAAANPAANTGNTQSADSNATAAELNPELISEEYRNAAARYEVNGYHISAPQAPGYAPYPAYPAYPAYPQPYAYAPYPVYPAYPAYPQPYAYAPYPTGYEGYGDYPADAQQPTEQQPEQNAYASAAGSRVVYDADWANGTQPSQPMQQRQPAQPQAPAVPVMQQSQSGKPHVNPAFIDPLSADDDDTVPTAYTEGVSFADRRKTKAAPQPADKPEGSDFFPAGFSAKNDPVAAGGKTTQNVSAAADIERENIFTGFSEDYEKATNRSQEWMMTDEEVQEFREKRRRETEEALRQAEAATEPDPILTPLPEEPLDEEEAQRRAEAQQIIAERFAQAAQEIKQNKQSAEQADAQQPYPYTSADLQMPLSDDEEDALFNPYYSDYQKGESDLYYNNPNENDFAEQQQNTAKNEKKAKKGGKFAAFIRRNTPHKGQTKREFISCLIMNLAFVVLIGGLIFCGIYLKNYLDAKNQEEEMLIEEPGLADRLTEVELEEWWNEMRAAYPDIDFPEGLNPDLAKLYAVNQDVAGWIEIEGIDLSTVILQADDNDYYLYRDLYKDSTKYGTPFVDYRNSMNSTDLSRNTIVYGHNTHDGLRFYNLTQYMQLSAYKKAPIVKLNTLFSGMTYWKIFAITLSDSTTDEFEYLYTSFSSESSFLDLIDDIRAHSMYDIDVDVVAGDNILTLYTCYQNLFADGRLTVFARQVRAGEDLTVNTGNASVNSDCLYPDAYYGITYENSTTVVDSGTTQSDNNDDDNTTESRQDEDATTQDGDYDRPEEDINNEENHNNDDEDYNSDDNSADDSFNEDEEGGDSLG